MNEWSLVYEGFRPDEEGLREALCTLGNGYFATRGAAPDARADGVHYPGSYLAGGYNRLKTAIAGREIENEDLVNLPNWLPLTFRIDGGDWFRLDSVDLLSYRQQLDLAHGLLLRTLRFRDAAGHTTRWEERRLVSMADCHLAALWVELTAEDWTGRLEIRSGIDGGVVNAGVARYRDLAGEHLETVALGRPAPDTIFLLTRTCQSLLHVAEAARTRIYRDDTPLAADGAVEQDGSSIALHLDCSADAGKSVTIEKIAALYSSRDRAISDPVQEACDAVKRAGRFDALAGAHMLAWRQIWDDCSIELADGNGEGTVGKLRLHVFHLIQTVSAHTADLDVGVPARGWHGEAYRGHIFWDELFIFPFVNLRFPTLARALLLYRYRRLPAARAAARSAGFEGAMFPWQSGSNGREESQRLHLNPQSGRWIPDNTYLQRHISSAIAYNVWKYFQVSDDREFMYSYGAELLFEIARFWASAVTWNPAIDRYEIRGVIGPDEYHTAYPDTDPQSSGGIDNNAYTNVLAAWVLQSARGLVELMPRSRYRKLCERLNLAHAETDRWDDISRTLRVPFHDDGIISQFDGYADLDEFDWPRYRDKYGNIARLDRILEAEGDSTNRYKVAKQADVLMLFYLFSADELGMLFERLGYPFDRDTIPRNIAYYQARTSHGSTLSQMVHSWVLSRLERTRSWDLFRQALDSDIGDSQHGTTAEGIHTGAMAGTVDIVERCYLGIEARGNTLHFDPAFAGEIASISVKLRYRRQVLDIEATHDTLTIASRSFTVEPITIAYRNHFRDLAPGDTCVFRLLRPEERDRNENR